VSNTTEQAQRKFDLRRLTGPFDIVGDVHGCLAELFELAGKLGYVEDARAGLVHPDGRSLVFVGDLGDRGPDSAGTFALAMKMVEHGNALYTPGTTATSLCATWTAATCS
jgi:protein phosphatase